MSREVHLPLGSFYPLLGGARVEGKFTASAPLSEIPAYVPAGALLVLLPETVQTLTKNGDGSVVSLADAGDDRVLWLYPGGQSSFSESDALRYNWDSSREVGSAAGASFEGEAVAFAAEENYSELELQGPGTLRFEDGSILEIVGGASDRALTVRLFHGE